MTSNSRDLEAVSQDMARILEAKRWVIDAVTKEGGEEAFGRAVDKARSLGVGVLSRDDMTAEARSDWDRSPVGSLLGKTAPKGGRIGMMNWPFIRQEMEREMK